MSENNAAAERKVASQTFDSVADLYDTYRPSYPAEIIDAIIELSGLQPGGRILEIGSGTGKATSLFAQRGYAITCLEPGQNLINAAARNLAAYPQVSFIPARFEEWEAEPEAFDLVFSAQAFHWVPEYARYEKTARVLKPGGSLALLWNMYPGMDTELRQELDEVYRQYAPEIAKPEVSAEEVIQRRADELRQSAYYENLVIRRVLWSARYDTQAYLGLLNTYSDHLLLPEEKRRVFFEKTAEVVERHGGTIDRPYLAVAYIAQKKAA